MYCAAPRTLARPSLRSGDVPRIVLASDIRLLASCLRGFRYPMRIVRKGDDGLEHFSCGGISKPQLSTLFFPKNNGTLRPRPAHNNRRNALEMAQTRAWRRLGFGERGDLGGTGGGGLLHGLFDGAADEVAGAEADGQSEREDDSAEEDSEGEFDDGAADLQVIERHGGGEDQNQPLDAKGEEACVVQLRVDCADEDRAREETGEQRAGNENQDGSGEVRDVGQKEDGVARVGGVGGVEGGDANGDAGEDADPEGDARGKQGGGARGRPVGDDGGRAGEFAGGEALVEADGGEQAAKQGGERPADQREDDEREQEGENSRQEADQHEDDSVDGLTERGFNLLSHG